MTHKTISKSERSGAIDLFRFLAVLFIFFSHYTDTYNYIYNIVPQNLKWSPISRYGSIALFVFFMVSGYVVTMTSMKRGIKDFSIARFSRIYPLFWVSCIVAFALPRLIHEHTYLMYSHFKVFVFNMTMMPQVFGSPMINPIFYTLLIELVFYFFIAFIILFKLWDKVLIVITLLLVYCLIHCCDKTISAGALILPFMAGMLWYFIKINHNALWKLYGLLFINYCCIIASSIPLIQNPGKLFKDPNPLNMWVVFVIITAIYIVFYLIILKKAIIKDTYLTRVLGEIAYPFYLFHIYFLFLYWYFRETIQADLLLLSVLMVVLAVSRLLNVWVEKPLSKWVSHLLYIITGFFSKKKNQRNYLPEQEPPPL
jgi:peptidoglycan/LPS O-acetylase OafA/YrhL